MSSPAEQLDAQFRQAPPPVTPKPPPVTSPIAAPAGLANDYMAHNDTMRAASAAESLDSAFSRAPPPPSDSPAPPPPPPASSSKFAAAGKDVGMGIVEMPRAVVKGVRDAYQGVLDLTKEVGDFTNRYLPALQVTGAGAPRIVTAAERAADSTLPGSLADHINLPDIAEPKSVTGAVEKNIVQFVTGMSVAGGQLKALGVPKLAGVSGRSITALKGFMGQFEAFDGAQQNLSNIVQSVPALQNPVTQFMATDPKDSDAVNRLKSAVEGSIGAQFVDAFVGGVRFLRNVNVAKQSAENAAGALQGHMDLNEDIGPAKSSGLDLLGDPTPSNESPLISANFNRQAANMAASTERTAHVSPDEVAGMGKAAGPDEIAGPASPGATEAQAKEPGVYLNFSKINSTDDISRTMSELADTFKGNIQAATRGVQTWENAKLGASAVDAWETLMSRRTGEVLNNEESLAARSLWVSATQKLKEVTQVAVDTPTPENLFAFRRMQAAHEAIQSQVLGARAEAARSLGSWAIPVGGEDYRMAQMLAAMKSDTGPASDGLAVSLNMAQRVQALSEAMDYDGLNNFTQKSIYARTRDAALEAWTNGLLTSPLTHVKVGVSNAATVALRIGERALAGRLSALLGDQNAVAVGEAASLYGGLVSGLKDSFRYAGRAANAFLNEEPLPALGNDPLSKAIQAAKSGTYSAGDEPEHKFGGAISSEAFNLSQSGWLGQGIDLLGQLTRSPGRALTAEHDFFRSIGYRMELGALATRQATQEVNSGKITEAALGGRVQEIMANPPPSVTIGAVDGMKYQTFTDAPGKLAALIEQARTDFPMMRVILPFYKIPSRILSFTFERSPLAPLMSAYQSNIAAGGARESLARAQMGLGTSMMLATADAVLSGQITGSGPPEKAQRGAMSNTGWLPYSMKVGDRWVQYNKIETVGSSMAMAADVVETMHAYSTAVNGDHADMEKLAVAAALSVAQNVTSKTYLQGLSNMFEMMANPKTEGESHIRSMAGSIVPAGLGAIDRLQDPYQRSVYSMLDAIKARIPGVSESLPARRDLWGDPVEHASGMGKAYDLLSPFETRQPTDSPIDREISRLGVNINMPAAKTSFGQGATVNLQEDPKVYNRYVQLAGNGYKDPAWGMGAKDLLNQVVQGQHPLSQVYNMKQDGPDGGKAEMIRGIINQYREGAKQQLLTEYPKLQNEIDQKRSTAQALQMPVIH